MDISSLGVASVAAITVICLLIGLGAKLIPAIDDRAIPVICGLSGAVLGALALFMGIPEFPATDYMTAVAVGIVSGLAATGANQVYKQITGGGKEG